MLQDYCINSEEYYLDVYVKTLLKVFALFVDPSDWGEGGKQKCFLHKVGLAKAIK